MRTIKEAIYAFNNLEEIVKSLAENGCTKDLIFFAKCVKISIILTIVAIIAEVAEIFM